MQQFADVLSRAVTRTGGGPHPEALRFDLDSEFPVPTVFDVSDHFRPTVAAVLAFVAGTDRLPGAGGLYDPVTEGLRSLDDSYDRAWRTFPDPDQAELHVADPGPDGRPSRDLEAFPMDRSEDAVAEFARRRSAVLVVCPDPERGGGPPPPPVAHLRYRRSPYGERLDLDVESSEDRALVELPFRLMAYGVFATLVARESSRTGRVVAPGAFTYRTWNVTAPESDHDLIRQVLQRAPLPNPRLVVSVVRPIGGYVQDDLRHFRLRGYSAHDALSLPTDD